MIEHLAATATPDQVVAAMEDQGFAVVERLLSPSRPRRCGTT